MNHLACVNELLGLDEQGFVRTKRGNELKGWITDYEGTGKRYLGARECRALSVAFAALADELEGA